MKTKPETITSRKLRNLYGAYAVRVLWDEYIRETESPSRRVKHYAILKALPSQKEFPAFRDAKFTRPLSEWLEEAYMEIDALRDELQEWFDNLPENFQDGEKGSQLEEAIGYLEQVDMVDFVNDHLNRYPVCVLPVLDTSSRPKRLGAVTHILEHVADELEDLDEDVLRGLGIQKGALEEVREHAGEIADEIRNHVSELEGVEFPGMFG